MTDKEWIVACKKCGAADSTPTTAFKAYHVAKNGTHGGGCGGELEAKRKE